MRWRLALAALVALGLAWWIVARADRGATTELTAPPADAAVETAPSAMPSARAEAVPEAAARVPSSLAITGRVLRPDGTPVLPGHVVFVWDENGKRRDQRVWTKRDGSFEIALDAPGVRGDLLAYVHEHRFAPTALTDVAAGSRDIELRLGPPAFFQVEIQDAHGLPVEPSWPSTRCSWLLAGHAVPFEGLGYRALPRSPVPFSVYVSARGFKSEEFGPFAPASVGERLVLQVTSLPRVRGRVVVRGEPVEGAKLELHALPESDKRRLWYPTGVSDPQGLFDIPTTDVGTYELRAFYPQHGGGTLAPIVLDGKSDVVGLELELTTPPGAIDGRVELPEGHDPGEIWLLVSGAGLRSLRSDGTYHLPGLPAGSCSVEITQGWSNIGTADAWIPFEEGRPPPPFWLRNHVVHTVEVRAGETTHLDLDLARVPRCRLVGRFLVDGQSLVKDRNGAPIPMVWLERPDGAQERDYGLLDLNGDFEVGVEKPGSCRLRLTFRAAGTRDLMIEDTSLTLAPGPTVWSLELTSASLRIVPAEGKTLRSPLRATWLGAGGPTIELGPPLHEPSRGSYFFPLAFAGRVRVQAEDGGALECELRAEETTEVVWPQ